MLSIVKTRMGPQAPGVRWGVRCKRKRCEGVGLSEELLHIVSTVVTGSVIERTPRCTIRRSSNADCTVSLDYWQTLGGQNCSAG